jgi:hypothetical protein
MNLRAWIGAVTIVAAACPGSGGPTNPGSNLEGTFSGTHVFSFTIPPEPFGITCQGTLVVNDVTAGSFTGTFTINPCAPLTTTPTVFPIQGTIVGQAVSFTFLGQDLFIDGIEQSLGCTVTRVDPSFAGSITSGRFQASFTATVTCEGRGTGEFSWVIDMLKAT